jgi:hypothetical protein
LLFEKCLVEQIMAHVRQPTVHGLHETLRNCTLKGRSAPGQGGELTILRCLWDAAFRQFGLFSPVNPAKKGGTPWGFLIKAPVGR